MATAPEPEPEDEKDKPPDSPGLVWVWDTRFASASTPFFLCNAISTIVKESDNNYCTIRFVLKTFCGNDPRWDALLKTWTQEKSKTQPETAT